MLATKENYEKWKGLDKENKNQKNPYLEKLNKFLIENARDYEEFCELGTVEDIDGFFDAEMEAACLKYPEYHQSFNDKLNKTLSKVKKYFSELGYSKKEIDFILKRREKFLVEDRDRFHESEYYTKTISELLELLKTETNYGWQAVIVRNITDKIKDNLEAYLDKSSAMPISKDKLFNTLITKEKELINNCQLDFSDFDNIQTDQYGIIRKYENLLCSDEISDLAKIEVGKKLERAYWFMEADTIKTNIDHEIRCCNADSDKRANELIKNEGYGGVYVQFMINAGYITEANRCAKNLAHQTLQEINTESIDSKSAKHQKGILCELIRVFEIDDKGNYLDDSYIENGEKKHYIQDTLKKIFELDKIIYPQQK